jgi:ADP-dependent phosphofructokinase/glucokinase
MRTKRISLNDVIKYVYKDGSDNSEEREAAFFKNEALFEDEKMSEEFFSLVHLQSQLTKAEKEPSQKSVNRILEFSRNFNVACLKPE